MCVCVCTSFFFFSVPCGRRGVNDTKLLIYLYFSLFFFGGGEWRGVGGGGGKVPGKETEVPVGVYACVTP